MTRLILPLLVLSAGVTVTVAQAHHPDRAKQPVRPRIDCIGPIGNNLPPSYRRVYNRPTNLGGKIAYWIAPTSQEAMAWHRAKHRGAYARHLPRQEQYYFYPKPWESLQIGPRPTREATNAAYPAAYGGPYGAANEVETVEMSSDVPPLPPPSLGDPLPPQTLGDPLMLDDEVQ